MCKPRRLTNQKVWLTAAGGTCAAEGKYSYAAYTTIGEYHIWPISAQNNCNRHVGYNVWFANTTGKIGTGLWRRLAVLTTLQDARRSCQTHMAEHNGQLVEQLVAA